MNKEKELILRLTKDDFDIETKRGSGPGGQYKNVTDSTVRMTHKPSGTVSTCGSHRSQHANKSEAFKKLVGKPSFRKWLDVEIARRTGVLDQIKAEIEESLKEHNIRTEIQKDGKWVVVDLKEIKE